MVAVVRGREMRSVCVRMWEAFQVKMHVTGRARSRCDHRLPALSDWLGIIASVSDAEFAVDFTSVHNPETNQTYTHDGRPPNLCVRLRHGESEGEADMC